jgi:hypothetical protein
VTVKIFGVQVGKTDDEKWAEAKTDAHVRRAGNGQRVTRSAKTYTPTQKLKDQQREINARNNG